MCVGYRSPLRAVWASAVGSRFEKILRRFVAFEVGGQTDSFGLSVIEVLGEPRELSDNTILGNGHNVPLLKRWFRKIVNRWLLPRTTDVEQTTATLFEQ